MSNQMTQNDFAFFQVFEATYHTVCPRLNAHVTTKPVIDRDQILWGTFRLDCEHVIEYEYDFWISNQWRLVEKVVSTW